LDGESKFIGKVGQDAFGKNLVDIVNAEKVLHKRQRMASE